MKELKTLTNQQIRDIGFSREMLAVLREHGIITGAPTTGGWTFSHADQVNLVANGPSILVAAAAIAEGRDRDGSALATLKAPPPLPAGMPPQPQREPSQTRYNRAQAAAALSLDVQALEMALQMLGIFPDDQGNYSASDVAALGKALKKNVQ